MATGEPAFQFPLEPGAPGRRRRGLHEQLRAAILDGRLRAGAELPSTRRVAEAYGIARNTVIAAYDLLIAEGYVLPRVGAKAVVADVATRAPKTAPHTSATDPRVNALWHAAALAPAPPRGLPPRSFRLGVPEHRDFPHAVWRRLSMQALRRWSREPFGYPPSEGLAELREAIAQHVAFARAVACKADDVIVTSGAQQAFDLVARLLVKAGHTRVAFEEPGYPPVRAAFAAAGAVLVPVPVDDEGLCVEQLPDDVGIVCVTPSHQSPTGVALSMSRRRALLAFAQRTGAVVLEDDYDGEFRFGNRPLDALQTLDRDGCVFYIGTFSKSLFPALRKGFVVAPAWARSTLVTVKHCTDSHGDAIVQATLAAFIREGHLARHVRRMRAVYAERREALLDALADRLAPWLEPIPSEAGLHLAARIRDPALAPTIIARIREHVPGAQSTGDYALAPLPCPAITFGYGAIDAADIPPAMAAFARSLSTPARKA